MADRRVDNGTRDRLEEIRQGYQRLAGRLLLVIAVQCIVIVGTLVAFYAVIERINDERHDNVVRECLSTNQRNLSTIAALEDGTVKVVDPASAKVLIGTMVPYTDNCEAKADEAVSGG